MKRDARRFMCASPLQCGKRTVEASELVAFAKSNRLNFDESTDIYKDIISGFKNTDASGKVKWDYTGAELKYSNVTVSSIHLRWEPGMRTI